MSLPIFLESFDAEREMKSDDRMIHRSRRTYNGRHFICHSFHGTLADQMFQYASLLAIASIQSRMIISNSRYSTLEDCLVNVNIIPGASHCKSIPKFVESSCCKYDAKMTALDKDTNYELDGMFKSWIYFKDHMDLVREKLRFQRQVIKKARTVKDTVLSFLPAKGANTTLIGVHVRRGNRLSQTAMAEGYQVAPLQYFHNAMTYFRQRIKGPIIFLVVTEDQVWSRSHLSGIADVLIAPSYEPETDLALLSLMDHLIISVGSLSWWAGFLGKGDVVYYKFPFVGDSIAMGEHGGTINGHFLPTWIGME